MELQINDDFLKKFKLNELIIKQTGSWLISLRPQQPTLGSLVLTLNRNCKTLSGINQQEGLELSAAFTEIEELLNKTLKPDKLNYLALMMVDNQVHFHVIPRYGRAIVFEGVSFVDSQWPGPPALHPLEMSSQHISSLLKFLRSSV